MGDEPGLATQVVLLNGSDVTFHYRPDSIGDQAVVQQIFTQQDYSVEHWAQGKLLRRLHGELIRAGMSPLIVDAGANIGASAVYFSAVYPGSLVYAIEPEPNNAVLLRLNCAGRNVRLFEGAIGAEDGKMCLVDPGLGDYGFRVEASGGAEVPVFSVEHVMRDVDRSKVFPFIFKIDIEGGEAGLFEKNTEWVDLFPLLVIELHDWLLPFQGRSRNFLKTIAANEFEVVHRGENLFCFNASFFPHLAP